MCCSRLACAEEDTQLSHLPENDMRRTSAASPNLPPCIYDVVVITLVMS